MTQIGHYSVSVDGEISGVRDNQDCPSHTMDTVGQLAARVAHGFNNLLPVIAGYRDLLLGLNVCAFTMTTRQLVHVSRNESSNQRSSRRTPSSRG